MNRGPTPKASATTRQGSIFAADAGLSSHVVSIEGKVDAADARELEQGLRDLMLVGTTTILVDISEAEFTPSLLGALIRVQRSLSWRNGRLLLACEATRIREQLTAVGLPDLFELLEIDELRGVEEPGRAS